MKNPLSVAVDPAAGRIYWSNETGSKISYASLSGGGGGNLNTAGASGNEATGLAIDPTTGRIYWADYEAKKIFFALLTGGGGGELNTSGATVDGPWGVAVDPTAGRIYWANELSNKISFANLNGTGGADLNTTGATLNRPAFPALLKAPSPAAAPQASGGPKPGSALSCVQGTWAPDLLAVLPLPGAADHLVPVAVERPADRRGHRQPVHRQARSASTAARAPPPTMPAPPPRRAFRSRSSSSAR